MDENDKKDNKDKKYNKDNKNITKKNDTDHRSMKAENVSSIADYSSEKNHSSIHSENHSEKRYSKKTNLFPSENRPSSMATRIKNARKAAKISQKELAKYMGVTRNTIVNWEAGKYRPDADLMPKLCACLHLTLNDLFGLTPAVQLGVSEQEWTLLNNYRKLSPVSQRSLILMARSLLDEEGIENSKRLEENTEMLPRMATKSAAGDGYGFNDIPIEDYQFLFKNSINKDADAIIQVKGDSMIPVYHSEDFVYVQYTNHAYSGEDVIVRSNEGLHIKRLGDEGVYSINRNLPFRLTSPADNVRIIGRVLGIVSSADYPSSSDITILNELRRNEIREFMEKYHLSI